MISYTNSRSSGISEIVFLPKSRSTDKQLEEVQTYLPKSLKEMKKKMLHFTVSFKNVFIAKTKKKILKKV